MADYNIDKLIIQVEGDASKAQANIQSLATALGYLDKTTASGGQNLDVYAKGIKGILDAFKGVGNSKVKNITEIMTLLNKPIGKGGDSLLKTAEGVTGLANGVKLLNSSRIGAVSRKLETLNGVLSKMDASKFGGLTSSAGIAGLGSRLDTMEKSLFLMSRNIQGSTRNMNQFNRATRVSTLGIAALYTKVRGIFYLVRRAFEQVKDGVISAMDFEETINLFETVFRKVGLDAGEAFEFAFLDRAKAFRDKLHLYLGLDPDDLMNYQARFGSMANSMGLVAETSYDISEGMTALGADMASLFNLDIENSMEKLRAGIAGQIRPLRELGVDSSNTALAQTALKYGIEDSVTTMNQATKVQLRYLTIMNQMQVAMGDMARTISSPSNQLRILQAQWQQLTRTLGQVFLPVLTTVMPYINGLTIALTRMLAALGKLFGWEAPSFDDNPIVSGVTPIDMDMDFPDMEEAGGVGSGAVGGLADDLGNVGSNAKDATKAVKAFQNVVMGFDELNILKAPSDSASGSTPGSGSGSGSGSGGSGGASGSPGTSGGGSGSPILDQAIQETTNSYLNFMNEQMLKASTKSRQIADAILDTLGRFTDGIKKSAAWDLLKDIGDKLKWVWDNTIVPIGKWVIDNSDTVANAALAILGGLAGAKFAAGLGAAAGAVGGFLQAFGAVKAGGALAAFAGVLTKYAPIIGLAIAGLLAVYLKGKQDALDAARGLMGALELTQEDMDRLTQGFRNEYTDAGRTYADAVGDLTIKFQNLNKQIDPLENIINRGLLKGLSTPELENLSGMIDDVVNSTLTAYDTLVGNEKNLWSAVFGMDGVIDEDEQGILGSIDQFGIDAAEKVGQIQANMEEAISRAVNGTKEEQQQALIDLRANLEEMRKLTDPDYGKSDSTLMGLQLGLVSGGVTFDSSKALIEQIVKYAAEANNDNELTYRESVESAAYLKKIGTITEEQYLMLLDSANRGYSIGQGKTSENVDMLYGQVSSGLLAGGSDGLSDYLFSAQSIINEIHNPDRTTGLKDLQSDLEKTGDHALMGTVTLVEEAVENAKKLEKLFIDQGLDVPQSIKNLAGLTDAEDKIQNWLYKQQEELRNGKDVFSYTASELSLAAILDFEAEFIDAETEKVIQAWLEKNRKKFTDDRGRHSEAGKQVVLSATNAASYAYRTDTETANSLSSWFDKNLSQIERDIPELVDIYSVMGDSGIQAIVNTFKYDKTASHEQNMFNLALAAQQVRYNPVFASFFKQLGLGAVSAYADALRADKSGVNELKSWVDLNWTTIIANKKLYSAFSELGITSAEGFATWLSKNTSAKAGITNFISQLVNHVDTNDAKFQAVMKALGINGVEELALYLMTTKDPRAAIADMLYKLGLVSTTEDAEKLANSFVANTNTTFQNNQPKVNVKLDVPSDGKAKGQKYVAGVEEGLHSKTLRPMIQGATGAYTLGKRYANDYQRGVNSIGIKLNVRSSNVKINTSATGGSMTIRAQAYAKGGFPDLGQFFIAREDGPELVGQMGQRTAVANNFQIVEGITAGVQRGMASLKDSMNMSFRLPSIGSFGGLSSNSESMVNRIVDAVLESAYMLAEEVRRDKVTNLDGQRVSRNQRGYTTMNTVMNNG